MGGLKDDLPSKCYVDLVIEGMRDQGCQKDAIAKLERVKTEDRALVSRVLPLEFEDQLPKWTLKKLETEAASGNRVYSVNGKVLKYEGPESGIGWNYYQSVFGKEMSFELAQKAYTPRFRTPKNMEEMSEDHRKFWEHELGGKWQARFPTNVKVVALISNLPAPKGEPEAEAAAANAKSWTSLTSSFTPAQRASTPPAPALKASSSFGKAPTTTT